MGYDHPSSACMPKYSRLPPASFLNAGFTSYPSVGQFKQGITNDNHNHYYRAVQKMRLKWALFCHFIIFVLMVLRSLPAFITELGYKSSVELPEVQVWEILWFLSTVTSVSICFTLRRRRIGLLRIVIAGNIIHQDQPNPTKNI